MESNDKAGIAIAQPTDKGGRVQVAKQCCAALEITLPVLVDELDDRVGHAYSGMPDRLYLIDRAGRVAYKGGRGPFGFKARELEQSMLMLLLDQSSAHITAHGLPVLTSAQAWAKLPRAERGSGQPLPAWARALAASLPRTTAAMLELDYAQRAKGPLEPQLRAKLRWVAAHANRSAYGAASAAADLRRAGLSDAQIRRLAGDWSELPAAERAALKFARKMSVDAGSVTDAEVSQLMGHYGDKQVVAMVLLLAYANFQDRLTLALGLTAEDGGPLPPADIRFSKDGGLKIGAAAKPPRSSPKSGTPARVASRVSDAEWRALDFGQLQQEMEAQRQREPRILVPSWADVRKGLPPAYAARGPVRIKWSLVCMGYQPELALGWGNCLRTFAAEAAQDRVFEESLFWVITRTLHCFY